VVQQRIKSTEEEVETLKEQLAYYKGQVDAYYKGIQEELGKVVNSFGEVGKKQTAQIDKLCELIIEEVHFPSSYLFFFLFFFLQKIETLHMSSIFSSKGKILIHTRALLLIW
jgi:hypothetical protein